MPGTSLFQNRWWVVLGAFLGLIVNQGAITFYAFAIFLKPVSDDLGVSRGTLSSAVGLLLAVFAVFVPVMGSLIDRFGVRTVLLPMIVLVALATAGLSQLRASPFILYPLFATQGLFATCQVPIGYAKVITAWFDRERGLALGVAVAGAGLGVALVPQLVAYLIDHHGWRAAYVGLGAAILLIAFVPVAVFVREPPSAGTAPGGAPPAPGISAGEAVRQSQFWIINIAFVLATIAINGTLAHVVALLTDRGLPAATATDALSVAGLAIIAGRIVSGYCVDRLFAPHVTVAMFCAPIVGIALLLTGGAGVAPFAGTVLCGLGIGAEIDLMAFFVGRYFGLRAFGAIYGLMFATFAVGSGLGSFLMGACFDLAGSYRPMLVAFVAVLIAACLLIARLGPYRYRAEAARERPGSRPM
jgi:MFS family permease